MKWTLLIMLSLISFNTMAEGFDNSECIRVYRDGYIELRQSVENYNLEQLNRWEFSAEVTAISTDVGVSRTICKITETPDASSCVEKYRNLYKKLRDRVKLTSVISGNQKQITYTEQKFSVSEKKDEDTSIGGRIRNFFRGAKEGAEQTRQLGELAFIDLQCQEL